MPLRTKRWRASKSERARSLRMGLVLFLFRELFDAIELRIILGVTLAWIFRDRLFHVLDAIARIGMVAQELRRARTAFFLQLVEKFDHVVGIVARVVHDLRTKQVSFSFCVARILQENRFRAELDAELRQLSGSPSTNHRAQHCQRNLRQHRLARLLCGMPQHDM